MNDSPSAAVTSGASQDGALSDRALATCEIVSVASSVALAEWMLASAVGLSKVLIAVPVVLAILMIVISHFVRGESLRDLGFRLDNFLRALYYLTIPVFLVAGLCLLIAWKTASPIDFLRWHPNRSIFVQFGIGFGWALAQQYVLQSFFNRRAVRVFGEGWMSVLLVAAVFSLLHLPNPWVTVITFVAGAIWGAVYQRAPNLFALALTHSIMTWFIVSTLPASMLGHLRVGLGYFG